MKYLLFLNFFIDLKVVYMVNIPVKLQYVTGEKA